MDMTSNIFALTLELEEIKVQEKAYKDNRIETENQIIALVGNPKLEGSVSLSQDDVSLTVSNAVNRTCDFEKLIELSKELPEDLQLVTFKPSLNLPNLRIIEKTAGAIFKGNLEHCITIKPKKVSVTMKRKS